MSVLQEASAVIRAAGIVLADEARWSRDALAKDAAGRHIDPVAPGARAFNPVGAVRLAAAGYVTAKRGALDRDEAERLAGMAGRALAATCPGGGMIGFSEDPATSHAALLDWFADAAGAAEAEREDVLHFR